MSRVIKPQKSVSFQSRETFGLPFPPEFGSILEVPLAYGLTYLVLVLVPLLHNAAYQRVLRFLVVIVDNVDFFVILLTQAAHIFLHVLNLILGLTAVHV